MERVRNKNTSFSTDFETFRVARALAALEDISLSELVDRALRKEVKQLLHGWKIDCQEELLRNIDLVNKEVAHATHTTTK
jgi:hypothetical protein